MYNAKIESLYEEYGELIELFCENRQNLVKQRITPHFLTTDHPNYSMPLS